ncbi:MAG TPA: BACON domain-containing carbohydrate-binding protein, partial [Bryobacteraceae bacterium]|nr:BACON domain-containing carbohydrate-binding protein [Bryobacteraceae bacterium]
MIWNRRISMMLLGILLLTLPVMAADTLSVNCPSSGAPGAAITCSVSLALGSDMIDNFTFGVSVAPSVPGATPASNVKFNDATSNGPFQSGTTTAVSAVYQGVSPLFTGTVALGTVKFTAPATAPGGAFYTVTITGASGQNDTVVPNTTPTINAGPAVTVYLPALGTNSLLVGPSAGTSSVLLKFPGAWTATSNSSFLHVASGSASGTGNALIVFTYDANAGTTSRTGTLTIAGVTFTVTQTPTNYAGPGGLNTLLSAGLSTPWGTAVDSSGNVYLADQGNAAIKEWTASTQQISTLVSSLSSPAGVAVDGAGNVYFADSVANTISEWNAGTTQVTALVSTGLSSPTGVALDTSGNVYFADQGNNAIKEWVASTQQVTTLVSSGLNAPTGVAVDILGNVYFADKSNNAIKEWVASTQQVTTLVSTGLNTPHGVAVDGSGNVYFADKGNGAVKEWVAATQQLSTLVGAGAPSPRGVAVDVAGNLYISDSSNNSLLEFTNAYVGPANGLSESSAPGTDTLLAVIPSTQPLTG